MVTKEACMKMLSAFILATAAALFFPAPSSAATEIIVSAAASLTDAFTEIGRKFEAENPDVKVVFNFGASGALLQQIAGGAPVDVFASADEPTMDQAEIKGLIVKKSRRDFACNRLVMVVPASSSLKLDGIVSLSSGRVRLVAIGNPDTVPAGRYAKEVLLDNRKWDALAGKLIFANNARQALDYVRRGETDAGFVFETDALNAKGGVRTVAVLKGKNRPLYPVALTSAGRNPDAGGRFIDFISGKGSATLTKYGFKRP